MSKVTQVYTFKNLQRVPETEVFAGSIVAVAGIESAGIGDTLADPNDPRPLPPIKVEEPTVRMTFAVNDSPFAGREGQYLTSRQIRARLFNELEHNVAMRVQDTERANEFIVSGRGELHLAIFIETMRREGYEFAVSRPEVIFKEDAERQTAGADRAGLCGGKPGLSWAPYKRCSASAAPRCRPSTMVTTARYTAPTLRPHAAYLVSVFRF